MNNRVFSGAPWEPVVGYARAVRAGNAVYVSGTTAVGPDGAVIGPGDAAAQARRCLEIIAAVLEESGASIEDVVRTRMFVTDIRNWEAIGRVHGEFFAHVCPATTMVEVKALIDPEMLVEIEAEAIIGAGGDQQSAVLAR